VDQVELALEQALPGEPPGRLPSVRAWASRLGAGTRTVQEALDRLVQRGVLRKRGRSGHWRQDEFPRAGGRSARTDATRIEEALAAELRSGLHPWNVPFPSVKEQARRWGCHPQTASRIFASLQSAGLLERRGRSYHPVSPRRGLHRTKAAILCVGAAGLRGELRMDTDREIDFWKELGIESSRLGLELHRVPWAGGKLPVDPSVVGVVASTWHLPDPEALYKVLDRVRVPVCVWIQDPSSHRSPVRSHPRLRFHDQGYGAASGRLLATHMFDRGHVHLAFVSPWHGSVWSRERLKGIRQEAVLRGGEVSVFSLDGISEWDRMAPAWEDPAIWEGFPAVAVARAVEGPVDPVREQAIRTLGWNRIRRDMDPLLQGALATGATAWIGANDECALIAQEWLAARGERRAVAGFDDTSGALRADLTSFRFDSGAMVRSMLSQILSQGRGPGLSRHEGVVVARGSDRPVQ
jgi:DNA-binding transcriptional regulator YhcF (GntR family)/DNA-binding LacI/PurR family transcriptional regulator